MTGRRPWLLVLLGVLALSAVAPLTLGLAADARNHAAGTLRVRGVYKLCARETSSFGVPHGTVAVEGYYLVLPFPGLGELGVLFDHKIARSDAYREILVPIPGSGSEQMGVKIAPSGLVIMGPPALVAHPPPSIPDGQRVVIRGTLFCRHLQQVSPFFLNGDDKPYMYMKSWRQWQKTRATATAGTIKTVPSTG